MDDEEEFALELLACTILDDACDEDNVPGVLVMLLVALGCIVWSYLQ